jgi:AraC family transcriptional regulator, activator of mtrCDE
MDLLSDILSNLKLKGTLYFRTSFTSPWSIRVPAFQKVSRFHFAHRGRCLVRIHPDNDAVLLEQGDLVIITHGAAHTLFCDPSTENPPALLDDVIAQSGFNGHGALVYGELGTHHETQLICGHFAFDADAQHPLIDALPESIHIKNYGESAGLWMENTLKVIGSETGNDSMGSDLIALKMSEIIYAQAMRSFLSSSAAKDTVLAGYADESLAKAIKVIHQSPEHAWSLQELAKIAGLSRTSFTHRFKQMLSMTPLGYMTHWRMQLARRQLTETNAAIIDIAEKVGYQSEAAFSRVFKKQFVIAPMRYRNR